MAVLQLVSAKRSHETITYLKQMLAYSQKGELVGVAAVGAFGRERRIECNATGLMYLQPDLARGYLAQLHDVLGKLSRGEHMPPGW